MNENVSLFINWNKALYSYFFENVDEEDEVSLYIDREKIVEIGQEKGLGGYEGFLRIIMLSICERQMLYNILRQRFIGTPRPNSLNSKYNSSNLFDFATIYIDKDFYKYLDCPFLIYVVFIIVMASESIREKRRDLGYYITEKLRTIFPKHNTIRDAWKDLFNELAKRQPRFCARKLTEYPYIGLVYYQLGLTKSQVNILEKAMYNADLSVELPYDQWIDKIVDYVDQDTKTFLRDSKGKEVIRKRISDLREKFDPAIYEQKHQNQVIQFQGHFVLAVYEDEYSEEEDCLVLLTDINNKSISHDGLVIRKGEIDRLGEYGEYNINHVLIGGDHKAQMKNYSLDIAGNKVKSMALGNIVTFSRSSNNYLIQTKYPQKGKETYILVRKGHDDEWGKWLTKQNSPNVKIEPNTERVHKIFGNGWNMYISNDIGYTGNLLSSTKGTSIIMNGGIRCIGKNKVYLRTGLPYFEFPEPINEEILKIFISVENKVLENNEYNYKIVDNNKLVIELKNDTICDYSLEISITLEYKRGKGKILKFHEDFDVIGQDVIYSDDNLFNVNMWGSISKDENTPYLKGLKIHSARETNEMPQGTGFYQNKKVDLDIHDKRFYLVNLFAAECSMRNSFCVTETRLKKCIRYAATLFDIDITSEPTFYTSIKFLLINCGYMNADFKLERYQPIPPTFLKTAIGIDPGKNLFMLVGSYTQKFLYELKQYCIEKSVSIYLQKNDNKLSKIEELIPPVILFSNNFDPNDFAKHTNSQTLYYGNEDIAINLLNAIPSYDSYAKTLDHVASNVFCTPLENPDSQEFPRIRKSRATGFSSSTWIEKTENEFHRITISDEAWATLYCLYEKQRNICTKDIDKLLFPAKLHLPVMIQRALYILNFGIPQKKKAFICSNGDSKDVYYNIVKRYKINDTNQVTRIYPVIRAITGRPDNEQNTSVRFRLNSSLYKMFIWKNMNRNSRNPRSLLVLTNIFNNEIYGLGIKKGRSFSVYLRDYTNVNNYRLVDSNNINFVFSKIISSNWVDMRLKIILGDHRKVSQQIGVNFVYDKCMSLPPREEYEIEEIEII